MGANGIHSTWKSHKTPSKQEPNIVPDEHHTTLPIWSHMFTVLIIYIPVTHRYLMYIQKQACSVKQCDSLLVEAKIL